MKPRRAWSGLVGLFAIIGAATVAYVGLTVARTNDSLGGVTGKVAETVERAALRLGTYRVQLQEVELADEDWTTDPASRQPLAVHLVISVGGRAVLRQDLGAFRGRKSFLDEPITFAIDYDGKTPITVELAEPERASDAKRYDTTDPWPFAHRRVASASRIVFDWRRLPEAGQ